MIVYRRLVDENIFEIRYAQSEVNTYESKRVLWLVQYVHFILLFFLHLVTYEICHSNTALAHVYHVEFNFVSFFASYNRCWCCECRCLAVTAFAFAVIFVAAVLPLPPSLPFVVIVNRQRRCVLYLFIFFSLVYVRFRDASVCVWRENGLRCMCVCLCVRVCRMLVAHYTQCPIKSFKQSFF